MLDDSGGFDYETVFYSMTPFEIKQANIAMDIRDDAIKRAAKKK